MAAKLSPDAARAAMRASAVEGAFASASDNAGTSFLSLYGLAMGATPAQLGVLAALPNLLSNVLQVPWALVTERLGRRRQIMLIGALGGRLLWLPLVFLPWISPSPAAAVQLMMAAVALRSAVAAMTGPAWTSLMADLVPRRVRGVYFANRNALINVAALGATLLAGLLLEVGGEPGGYQLIYAFCVVMGAAAAVYMARMPDLPWEGREAAEPATPETRTWRARWRRTVAVFRRAPNFNRYCGTTFIWTLGVHLPAPLFAVYFVRDLGGAEAAWGIVTAANFAATVLAQRYWGLLTQRFGEKRIMLLSGVGAAVLPFLWLLIPVPSLAIAVNGLGGFFWAGYNLASFNLLLELAPPVRRTTYVALYNTTVGLGATAGPLLGGFGAAAAGIPLVLVVSGVVRFVGLWLFARTVEQPMVPMTAADLLPLWVKWWRQMGTRAVMTRLRVSLRPRPAARRPNRRNPGRGPAAGRDKEVGRGGRTLPGGPSD
ncbi:MAG: MFS transporter [Limnochordales bacterium]|nr:MFS transporter [Limnochordales bacterium]